jgi:hypothetical protein
MKLKDRQAPSTFRFRFFELYIIELENTFRSHKFISLTLTLWEGRTETDVRFNFFSMTDFLTYRDIPREKDRMMG